MFCAFLHSCNNTARNEQVFIIIIIIIIKIIQNYFTTVHNYLTVFQGAVHTSYIKVQLTPYMIFCM